MGRPFNEEEEEEEEPCRTPRANECKIAASACPPAPKKQKSEPSSSNPRNPNNYELFVSEEEIDNFFATCKGQ